LSEEETTLKFGGFDYKKPKRVIRCATIRWTKEFHGLEKKVRELFGRGVRELKVEKAKIESAWRLGGGGEKEKKQTKQGSKQK